MTYYLIMHMLEIAYPLVIFTKTMEYMKYDWSWGALCKKEVILGLQNILHEISLKYGTSLQE